MLGLGLPSASLLPGGSPFSDVPVPAAVSGFHLLELEDDVPSTYQTELVAGDAVDRSSVALEPLDASLQ